MEAKDFPALIAGAKTAWDAAEYGKASTALNEASKMVTAKYRGSLLAAFPAAPEGWTFRADKQDDAAMMMMGLTGLSIERRYSSPENESCTLTLMVNSPMIQMMTMAFANPALLGDDVEVIKYGKHQAILKKKSSERYELQILIGDDLLQAASKKMSDDALLSLCSQAMVDKLEAVLAK